MPMRLRSGRRVSAVASPEPEKVRRPVRRGQSPQRANTVARGRSIRQRVTQDKPTRSTVNRRRRRATETIPKTTAPLRRSTRIARRKGMMTESSSEEESSEEEEESIKQINLDDDSSSEDVLMVDQYSALNRTVEKKKQSQTYRKTPFAAPSTKARRHSLLSDYQIDEVPEYDEVNSDEDTDYTEDSDEQDTFIATPGSKHQFKHINLIICTLAVTLFHFYLFNINRNFSGQLFTIPLVSDMIDFSSRTDSWNIIFLSTMIWSWLTYFSNIKCNRNQDRLFGLIRIPANFQTTKKQNTTKLNHSYLLISLLHSALYIFSLFVLYFNHNQATNTPTVISNTIQDVCLISIGYYFSQILPNHDDKVRDAAMLSSCVIIWYYSDTNQDSNQTDLFSLITVFTCVITPLQLCIYLYSQLVPSSPAISAYSWHWIRIIGMLLGLNVSLVLDVPSFFWFSNNTQQSNLSPPFLFSDFVDFHDLFQVVFNLFRPPSVNIAVESDTDSAVGSDASVTVNSTEE